MPRYRVRAVDRSGTLVSCVSAAIDKDAVGAALQDRGWTVLSVTPVSGERWKRFRLQRAMASSGSIIFSQWANLIRVGVPLDEALQDVESLALGKPLSDVLGRVRRAVQQGDDLVDAMTAEAGLLSDRHLAGLKSGQRRDALADALTDISVDLAWRAEVLGRLRQAASYPVFAGILLTAVSAFLILQVVPSLEPMLRPMMDEMPWVTKQLIYLSVDHRSVTQPNRLITFGVLGFLLFLVVLVRILNQSVTVRQAVLKRFLQTSFALRWLWPFSVATHAHTLRFLLRQQVSLPEAMRLSTLAASVMGTGIVWERVARDVERRGGIYQALKPFPEIPRLYLALIDSGERGGTLTESLSIASSVFKDQTLRRFNRLDALVGPVLIVFVGALMVGVITWVLLPVYDLLSRQDSLA